MRRKLPAVVGANVTCEPVVPLSVGIAVSTVSVGSRLSVHRTVLAIVGDRLLALPTVTVPEFLSITTRSDSPPTANADAVLREIIGVTVGDVPSTAFGVAG